MQLLSVPLSPNLIITIRSNWQQPWCQCRV